jgi:hypothetical protein
MGERLVCLKISRAALQKATFFGLWRAHPKVRVLKHPVNDGFQSIRKNDKFLIFLTLLASSTFMY